MRKMAFVMVRLVREADERRNEDLEKEIFRKLEESHAIPWCEKIEKITVLEAEVVAENPTNQLWELDKLPLGEVWVSGSVSEGTHEGYIFPIVSFMSTDREFVEDIAHMMEAPVYVHDRSPYQKPLYITIATHEYAVATILHLRPHLTRWNKRASEILEKYRKSPQLPIPECATMAG